jgi:hypothetical protein
MAFSQECDMDDSLFGVDIINLIQAGFHGAALAVLLVTAYLLRDYSQRVLTIDKEKQDIRVVEGVRTLIVIFMGVSVLFFVFGVGAQIYSNKESAYAAAAAQAAANSVPSVETIPTVVDLLKYENLEPTILKDGTHIEPGQTLVVKDGEGLFFSVKGLTNKLYENEMQLKILRTASGTSAGEEAGL